MNATFREADGHLVWVVNTVLYANLSAPQRCLKDISEDWKWCVLVYVVYSSLCRFVLFVYRLYSSHSLHTRWSQTTCVKHVGKVCSLPCWLHLSVTLMEHSGVMVNRVILSGSLDFCEQIFQMFPFSKRLHILQRIHHNANIVKSTLKTMEWLVKPAYLDHPLVAGCSKRISPSPLPAVRWRHRIRRLAPAPPNPTVSHDLPIQCFLTSELCSHTNPEFLDNFYATGRSADLLSIHLFYLSTY